jgi:hypothetical protein
MKTIMKNKQSQLITTLIASTLILSIFASLITTLVFYPYRQFNPSFRDEHNHLLTPKFYNLCEISESDFRELDIHKKYSYLTRYYPLNEIFISK